jgi:hypothetical protein
LSQMPDTMLIMTIWNLLSIKSKSLSNEWKYSCLRIQGNFIGNGGQWLGD